ncbi:MAG: prepilin-type N-terminal cleavage/methylation domain-containing protein [Bacilli bacterium]|nr:prepilin-type N-terminal cleavage/methylation domain-containing protein [Bacilli bacterium]
MNKKGFTTVELILTVAIVSVLMVTITGVTYVYQERTVYERGKNELINYKNTVTKIIYDDIFDIGGDKNVVKLSKESNNTYHLIKNDNTYYKLIILNETGKVGIKYGSDDSMVDYVVPGSDKGLVRIKSVEMYPEGGGESDIYKLDIIFEHLGLNQEFKIHLIFSK